MLPFYENERTPFRMTDSKHAIPRGGDIKVGQIYWLQNRSCYNFPDSHMCVILTISESKRSVTVVPITSSNKTPNVFLGELCLPDGNGKGHRSFAAIDNIMTIQVNELRRYAINIDSVERSYIDPSISQEQHAQLLEYLIMRIVVLKKDKKSSLFEKLARRYCTDLFQDQKNDEISHE